MSEYPTNLHSYITNKIFDLGDEANKIIDRKLPYNELRLLEIRDQLLVLQARLKGGEG